METETITLSEFPNGQKSTIDQIIVLEEIIKSNRAQLIETESGILVRKLISRVVLIEKSF